MAITLINGIGSKIKNIGHKGFPYVVKGAKRFCSKKDEVIDFYMLDLKNGLMPLHNDAKEALEASLGGDFMIKVLSPQDQAYRSKYMDFVKTRQDFTDEYAENYLHNAVCFLGLVRERIVAMACMASLERPLEDFEVDIILDGDQVYRYGSFVDPEYRRKGIMSLLWDYEIAYAASRGYAYMVAAIRQWNAPSYLPTLKFGFVKYATLSFKEQYFVQRYKATRLQDDEKMRVSIRRSSGDVVRI